MLQGTVNVRVQFMKEVERSEKNLLLTDEVMQLIGEFFQRWSALRPDSLVKCFFFGSSFNRFLKVVKQIFAEFHHITNVS